jgi:hypothetical protein
MYVYRYICLYITFWFCMCSFICTSCNCVATGRGGVTVKTLCSHLHRDMLKEFKYALCWGQSCKHAPQRVGKDHELMDEDVVQVVMPSSHTICRRQSVPVCVGATTWTLQCVSVTCHEVHELRKGHLLVQIFKKTAKEYGLEKKGKILTKQGEQAHYKQCICAVHGCNACRKSIAKNCPF